MTWIKKYSMEMKVLFGTLMLGGFIHVRVVSHMREVEYGITYLKKAGSLIQPDMWSS